MVCLISQQEVDVSGSPALSRPRLIFLIVFFRRALTTQCLMTPLWSSRDRVCQYWSHYLNTMVKFSLLLPSLLQEQRSFSLGNNSVLYCCGICVTSNRCAPFSKLTLFACWNTIACQRTRPVVSHISISITFCGYRIMPIISVYLICACEPFTKIRPVT